MKLSDSELRELIRLNCRCIAPYGDHASSADLKWARQFVDRLSELIQEYENRELKQTVENLRGRD